MPTPASNYPTLIIKTTQLQLQKITSGEKGPFFRLRGFGEPGSSLQPLLGVTPPRLIAASCTRSSGAHSGGGYFYKLVSYLGTLVIHRDPTPNTVTS